MTTIIPTDDQITALRDEAHAADDGLQVALCDIALASGLGEIAQIDEILRGDLERLGVVPEHVDADVRASALCAKAINAALAMDDSE